MEAEREEKAGGKKEKLKGESRNEEEQKKKNKQSMRDSGMGEDGRNLMKDGWRNIEKREGKRLSR